MKKIIFIFYILLNIVEADIKIVVTRTCTVESIPQNGIKNIFMLKQQSLNEEPVTVIDRSEKELYTEFLDVYLGKTLRQMKTYWVRMLFTGKKIAPEQLAFEELSALEHTESCYMSYAEEQEVDNLMNWKAVEIK